jgi:hypothetical protein
MTIARVTMHEFFDEDGIENVEKIYTAVRDELFPNLLQVINIKTGPTSGISIALYPSFEEAEKNLTGRQKMLGLMEPYVKDSFYHEGEVTHNHVTAAGQQG